MSQPVAPVPVSGTPPQVRAEGTPPQVPAKTRGPRRRARLDMLVGWSFILPNFVGFALFTLVPVVIALTLTFMEWDAFSSPEWVGLSNIRRMMSDPAVRIATVNTVKYSAGHIPLTMAAALGLALLLNRRIKGVAFFRSAAFFPYITSLVAVAVVWNMLFNPTAGPVNQFLSFLGMENTPGWTTSTDWAMPAVVIASVWRDMGYYMVLYLAGLQTIPQVHYEAASVDGANAWQKFRHITLPGLRPTTFLVLVLVTIASFKIFDLVVVMTQGGPGRATLVLSQQIWIEGIVEGNFGYGSAISLLLFLMCLVVTLALFKLNARKDV